LAGLQLGRAVLTNSADKIREVTKGSRRTSSPAPQLAQARHRAVAVLPQNFREATAPSRQRPRSRSTDVTFVFTTDGNTNMAIRDIAKPYSGSLWAFVVCAAAGAALGTSPAIAQTGDPSGVWLVADQTAKIRIEHCADGYWGSIDWERQAGIDSHNPDPARRGKPLLGTPILISMKPSEPNEWQGKVYNPQDGGFYKASISLLGANQLKLEGCMWVFCSGETWTRAPELPRMTTGAAAQPHPRSVCPQQSSQSAPR
jgi:uncharacterized protein (DUF2147 family)